MPRTKKQLEVQELLNAALTLPLIDRVLICKALKDSLIKEAADKQAQASEAKSITEGL